MNRCIKENKTKIVATIGPATSSKENLRELIKAGVDVCRLNFSHGAHEEHLEVINNILDLNKELGCNVALLADLQGPKLRVGVIENNGIELVEGHELEFVNYECTGNAERVYMSYQRFPQDVKIGDVILIDDGKIKLEATYTDNDSIVRAKVLNGGILSSKKGVNLPSTKISLPSLTDKDKKDAEFALSHGVDWIALSFVRSANDVIDLKNIVKKNKSHAGVIAKIEKPEALEDIDGIIEVANGIMVARGDLGVELPFTQVPILQKTIVEKCIKHAKPVIIATQMMESMISNFSPTRAEANDVANAVIDGASALMLSGETSVGKYPIEVIKAMTNIISFTEKNGYKYNRKDEPIVDENLSFIPDSTCASACKMAEQSRANSIVTIVHSGHTASKIASHRPKAHIFAFTPDKDVLRQLSLLWGVKGFYSEDFIFINDAIEHTLGCLKENNFVQPGELVVHVGSMPLNKKGQANMVKLSYV